MLSPQDLLAWSIQRFKYVGGTLDIFWNDTLLRRPGLTGWQRLMYGATAYSYFSPLWTVIFLLSPTVYFFTGVAPVTTYDATFFAHLPPRSLASSNPRNSTPGSPACSGRSTHRSCFAKKRPTKPTAPRRVR